MGRGRPRRAPISRSRRARLVRPRSTPLSFTSCRNNSSCVQVGRVQPNASGVCPTNCLSRAPSAARRLGDSDRAPAVGEAQHDEVTLALLGVAPLAEASTKGALARTVHVDDDAHAASFCSRWGGDPTSRAEGADTYKGICSSVYTDPESPTTI